MSWTKADDGTLRDGELCVLKMNVGDITVYMPLRLTARGWLHLSEGISCDSAEQAKRVCERYRWEESISD